MLSRERITIAIGGLLLVAGFLYAEFSVDPKRCEGSVSDSRTTGELFQLLAESSSPSVPPMADLDLAISEVLAMQDGRSVGVHTKISRFFQAAYLMEGSIRVVDHEGLPDSRNFNATALSVLSALKTEFPENGVFAFFRAAVLKEQGSANEAIRQEFIAAFQAPTFDPFVRTISRRIYEMGLSSVENHATAKILIAQIRMPNLLKGFFALKEQVLASDTKFANQVLLYAEKVVRDGNLNLAKPDRVFRWMNEYAIAQNLIRVAWPKVHESESIPPEFEYSDLEIADRSKNGRVFLSSWTARQFSFGGCSALQTRALELARANVVKP